MGKRKSNSQKREIAARQKTNKIRKAEKLRQVLKRNFDDMTPLSQWEINKCMAWIDSIESTQIDQINKEDRRKILSRDFSDMWPDPNYKIERFNKMHAVILADLNEWKQSTARRYLIARKFNWKSDDV